MTLLPDNHRISGLSNKWHGLRSEAARRGTDDRQPAEGRFLWRCVTTNQLRLFAAEATIENVDR
jgi:hypothetical protein